MPVPPDWVLRLRVGSAATCQVTPARLTPGYRARRDLPGRGPSTPLVSAGLGPRCDVQQRCTCGNHSGLIAKAIPGSAENRPPSRRNHCSPSARIRVRLHPGTLFAITLRPSTTGRYRAVARHFLSYLQTDFPQVRGLSELRRDPHLLGWLRRLTWLVNTPSPVASLPTPSWSANR